MTTRDERSTMSNMGSGGNLDCRRVKELLFLYYDNELERPAMVAFYRHAEHCPKCWRRVGYTTRLLTTVTLRTRRSSAPLSLRERISRLVGD